MTLPAILPPVGFVDPAENPHDPAVRAWAAHVAAGRIGTKPPTDPHVTASLLAADALFRSFDNPRPVWERWA